MSQLITWTVASGSMVFVLGLVSAIGSRHRRNAKIERNESRASVVVVSDHVEIRPAKRKTGIEMAAGGSSNGGEEDSVAAVGSYTR